MYICFICILQDVLGVYSTKSLGYEAISYYGDKLCTGANKIEFCLIKKELDYMPKGELKGE